MIVLFYKPTDWVGRLIVAGTGSPYSHVAIMINGEVWEADGSHITGHFGKDAYRRVAEADAFAVVAVSPEDAEQVLRWLRHQAGQHRYSKIGFLMAGITTFFPRLAFVATRPNEYICSGLVAQALQIAGKLPDAEARLETPASLARRLRPMEVRDG